MPGAFDQAWSLLKAKRKMLRQLRLPGYEGKVVPDSRRRMARDGSRFMDDGPEMMGPSLGHTEFVMSQKGAPTRKPRPQPARIVIDHGDNPMRQFAGDATYRLVDENGRTLSEIATNLVGGRITDYAGETPEQFRRQGYYRELLENLIRHGYQVESTSRNRMSDPFHKKFIRTLPGDIDVQTTPEAGWSEMDEHIYSHQPYFPGGDWGDLVGETRTTVPIYDRTAEHYRPKGLTSPTNPRGMFDPNTVWNPNRSIVVPSDAAREILARPPTDGYDFERERVLQQLMSAQPLTGRTYPSSTGGRVAFPAQIKNPRYDFRSDENPQPEFIDNPAFGSKVYVQERLPGLYASDYQRNSTQPLVPQDAASRKARERGINYIQ